MEAKPAKEAASETHVAAAQRARDGKLVQACSSASRPNMLMSYRPSCSRLPEFSASAAAVEASHLQGGWDPGWDLPHSPQGRVLDV